MKRQVYISSGFTDSDYSVPYWVYPRETVAPAYGFGVYEIVYTSQTPKGTDFGRFNRDVNALPPNSLLYINHESGPNCWPWASGDITQPNPAGINEHRLLQSNVRANRPDIAFSNFNASMRTEIIWFPSWAKIIRQSNEVIRLIGNGCHFLLPCFYPRKEIDPLLEIRSFAECIRAAREIWPTTEIIPAITTQFNGEVCRLVWPAAQQPTFRWTQEQIDACNLPPYRLFALLEMLAAEGITKVFVWSAGYVPVDLVKDNLELLREWQNQ